jgi:hypothetical protein
MNCRNSSTPFRKGWLKSALFGAALVLFGTAANAQTIWDTGSLTFTKTAPGQEDAITSQTHLTRVTVLYNSICETISGNQGCSYPGPCNTEWAIGTIANWNTYTYQPLFTVNGCSPPSMVGQTMVCHLIAENIYCEVTWNSWQTGGGGGGFSYTRTTATDPVMVSGALVGDGG